MRAGALRVGCWLLAPLAAHAGDPLPDLRVAAGNFSLELDTNVELGDVAEGCASAATGVDLLRFDAITSNALGNADLSIGDPLCPSCETNPGAACGNPDFHCSPAGGHEHPHFTDYARYELLLDGVSVRQGGKFGFCLADTECEPGVTPKFDCDFQGLTAGCEDLYSSFLGCQYIEVTGLPAGEYTVRVTVDPEDRIPETRENNNSEEYDVVIEGTEEPEQPMPGTSLLVKRLRRGDAFRLVLRAKAAELPFGLPSASLAPTIDGALLAVVDAGNAADAVVIELPAAGWKGLGRPRGRAGYRFHGGPTDACSRAKITRNRVTATCTSTRFVLPASGEIAIELGTGGAKRYCARFGGTEKRNDGEQLRRVEAEPADCPET